MPFDLSDKIDHKVLRKSEDLLFKPLNEENIYDIRELKNLRNENPYRVIGNNLDILMVSETKIEDTFPESQFLMEGFSTPYRIERTANSGGILLYIRHDIPSKYIKKSY